MDAGHVLSWHNFRAIVFDFIWCYTHKESLNFYPLIHLDVKHLCCSVSLFMVKSKHFGVCIFIHSLTHIQLCSLKFQIKVTWFFFFYKTSLATWGHFSVTSTHVHCPVPSLLRGNKQLLVWDAVALELWTQTHEPELLRRLYLWREQSHWSTVLAAQQITPCGSGHTSDYWGQDPEPTSPKKQGNTDSQKSLSLKWQVLIQQVTSPFLTHPDELQNTHTWNLRYNSRSRNPPRIVV